MAITKKTKNGDADFVIDEKGKPHENEEETTPNEPKSEKSESASPIKRFIGWYKNHKKLSIPLTLVLLVAVLAALPLTRYQLAGMFMKKNFKITVLDTTTGTAISGADVNVNNLHAVTDANGTATIKNIKVGKSAVSVSKKYYKNSTVKVLVPIFDQKTAFKTTLDATGRQVKVNVKNLISHNPLADVTISVDEINAKTDKSGSAIIVLPIGTKSAKATLNSDGFNKADVNIVVDDKTIKENNFTLTPTGKVYFLSKLSGKIDVIKTNLDGSGRQTVLAGTGREDNTGTVLLASRDWKYLALLSRRDGGSASKLFLINTADDSLARMDNEANAQFSPVGWSDHHFVYRITRSNVQYWQPNSQAIKSYDADAKKLATIDQTRGEANNQSDYAVENYGSIYQVGKNVIFDKYWSSYYGYYGNRQKLAGKQNGIYSISVSGTNAQTLKAFDFVDGETTYVNSVPYEANQVYYQVNTNDKPSYFAYKDGKISAKSDIADDFNKYSQQGAETYLQSPTGANTFWAEERDGKNTLFIGNSEGDDGKQIASLAEYRPYGWFTDEYLLVSKNSSELYIIPQSGIGEKSQPIKITDYHKPAQNFYGYGGGYGGI